jgi:hypothetical protein
MQSEWISLQDRLPEFGVKVLVYDFEGDETDYKIGEFSKARTKTGWHFYPETWHYGHDTEPCDCKPTHWMPLPEKP